MAYSYQKSFFEPTQDVSHDLLIGLLRDHNNAHKVDLIRQIKTTAATRDWTVEREYQQWFQQLKAKQRQALEGKTSEELALAWADGLKRSLSLVIFVGNFDETLSNPHQKPGEARKAPKLGRWRKKEGLRLNGLCVMDLDHVVSSHNPDDVRRWWQQVSAHLDLTEIGIKMVYISASGDGVKVVFKARMEWGNLIDNQHRMAELLGVAQFIDEKCKDGSRGHFITKEEDVIFLDETDFYDYYLEAFDQKWTPEYRQGHTQPTKETKDTEGSGTSVTSQAASQEMPDPSVSLSYHGIPIEKIIEAWLGGKVPQEGSRHDTMRNLSKDIRYCLDNTPKKVMKAFESQPWIQDLIAEGDPVEATVEGACKQKYYNQKPIKLKEALIAAGFKGDNASPEDTENQIHPLFGELQAWGEQIHELFDVYPCLREICQGLRVTAYPCALFVGAAFLGTDMTRTWYYYYHRPEEERRLNYCIYIIGDPAVGKSFATSLYKHLAAPLIAADKMSNDAINRYKKALKERGTSTKEQKKDALKQPEVIVRVHGARTANGVFIEDMNRAVELVGDKEIHLHLLSFDSELDSSTCASKGGQWIDKSTMELKAFHNEEDNQQYKNVDSVTGPFDVYWNYIYTGTPLSLKRKVTEANFGSGLSTRLACIPMPGSNFEMMPLERRSRVDHSAEEVMKTWAYRLDRVSGELPVWPLVEDIWTWTRDRLLMAKIDQDKADELLIMRVGYYGIAIATPFILMRHWEEWEAAKTFTIDEQDKALCQLVLNIQYHTQHYFFGKYARNYFDNMENEANNNRRRRGRTKVAFDQLPVIFKLDDVVNGFGTSVENARVIVCRLVKDNCVERQEDGTYRKLCIDL